MGPDRIVMAPPAFDDDLSFVEGVEDLAIEQLIAQARVEALDVAVLPRTAPLDVGSLGADSGDPSLDGLGDEAKLHRVSAHGESLDKDAPIPRAVEAIGRILSHLVLGGLHHQYVRT